MFINDFAERFGPVEMVAIATRLYELEQAIRTTNGIPLQPKEEFFQDIVIRIDKTRLEEDENGHLRIA